MVSREAEKELGQPVFTLTLGFKQEVRLDIFQILFNINDLMVL